MKKTARRPLVLLWIALAFYGSNAMASVFCSQRAGASEGLSSLKRVTAGTLTTGIPVSLLMVPKTECDARQDCRVRGAPVLAGAGQGVELAHDQSWICVGIPGKRPLDVWYGWVPRGRWKAIATSQTFADQWLGVWQNDHAKIEIRTSDAQALAVRGNAIFDGGSGGPDFGDFDFIGTPKNGMLTNEVPEFSNGCAVALHIAGKFLVAADNGQCGGMNVNFDGVYRLRRRLQ
ncbi:hypothetical protein LJR034_001537 [Caballeronia sp. LjRoot34]|uniref:hypothetical protein n=1 Tax=Caballeronia sp. LjRoot34 TaxID=3342325 RepID=UPI003ECF5E12